MIESEAENWELMQAFFKEKGLVRQHLDSYNYFIEHTMQQIVDETGKIEFDISQFYVKLGKITVGEPSIREADGSIKPIFPMEARIRNLTYAANLRLEMTPVYKDERTGLEVEGEMENVYIGRLPIMLRSQVCLLKDIPDEELPKHGEDPRDPGGYFIINGSERVLVTREDLAPNRILIEEASQSLSAKYVAKVFSTSHGFRAPVTLEQKKDGSLRVTFPSVPGKIPLAILMRALGLVTDKEIFEAISDDMDIRRQLIPTLEVAVPIYVAKKAIETTENALDYIGKRVAVGQTKEYRLKRAGQVLDRYLLPHVGRTKQDRLNKSFYLGQMAQRLLELSVEKREPDDKDHYANKRLKLAGDLLTSLFRVAFMNLCRDIKYQLERTAVRGRRPNIRTAVRADVVTERLRHALATGNWVGGKAGVSQLLDRTNYISALSHLRRVVSPLSRSQPHFEARDLHPTHWGKICPNETPEGPNCGLVKNLTLMSYISVGMDEVDIERLIIELKVQDIKEMRLKELKAGARVFLNGRLIGIHQEPQELVDQIRIKRRKNEINHEVNIAFYDEAGEIQINCDAGRARRPLIIVEKGKSKYTNEIREKMKSEDWTWSELIKRGIIEYLDAEEEENCYVAMYEIDLTPEHTHLEITPSTILGITAAIIPYPEHNQSPRNTYEAGMAKQALGLYSTNFNIRVDTRGHLLHYSQKPMVKTKAMDAIGFDNRPAGQNFIIGIISFEGYNIEDALIINKGSIERGLAVSTFFRCYESEERKYPGGQEDKFEIPNSTVRGYRSADAYKYLGEDGIIEPEIEVNEKDNAVLIGRTSPPRFLEEYREFELPAPTRRETSITMRHGENGIIDSVILTETIDGNKLVKIKVRDQRKPELGDKFASRHGQKGVLGLIVPHEDMPFTADGVVPDLIINPHAIPSRMTLGQIFEAIAGKVGALAGQRIDGTAFSRVTPDVLYEEMTKHGFSPTGREPMYSGATGQKFEGDIFVGIVYYQKLHHMVADKIHARARGPVQILTRQPTEGRAREGGLRFGEMERDCLIGHGAALLLKERLLDESDKSTILVCEQCGMIGVHDHNKDKFICPICGDKVKISRVTVSYAFKLLLQELLSLNIMPKLRLRDRT